MEDEQTYQGSVLLSWPVEEFERHERGTLWYLFAVLVGAGFLIYALVVQNFLFAVIIVMFGVILGLSALREPRELPFIVTDIGVGVGDQFFPYKELSEFWIVYDPPEVKNVYFEFKRSLRPHLVIPLYEEDPVELREILINFLDENPEEEDEPLSDFFGRMLKL